MSGASSHFLGARKLACHRPHLSEREQLWLLSAERDLVFSGTLTSLYGAKTERPGLGAAEGQQGCEGFRHTLKEEDF